VLSAQFSMGGKMCGGGTQPSEDPASSETNEDNWRNCRACQLRDQLCDECTKVHGGIDHAAADKPPQPEIKRESASIRPSIRPMAGFDSQHIEQTPDVAAHPDWYDPHFQAGSKNRPVMRKKFKALRDEFDEDEEDGAGPPQRSDQQAPFTNYQDEFS